VFIRVIRGYSVECELIERCLWRGAEGRTRGRVRSFSPGSPRTARFVNVAVDRVGDFALLSVCDSGLGLSIVTAIVESHTGSIEVTSTL